MTDAEPSSPTTSSIEGFKAIAFFPADYAAPESGKVYASGAYWTVLRFPAFPAVLPSVTLVAVLQQPFHAYLEDHQFEMTLEDADGEKLPLRVQGQFRAAPGSESKYGDPGVIPMAVPIYGMEFERAGDYAFVLHVDNVEIARYHFHVIQVFGANVGMPVPPSNESG